MIAIDDTKIAANKNPRKVFGFILGVILTTSVGLNVYQNYSINELKKNEEFKRHEILLVATEAFKRYYKNQSNDNLDDHLLNKFDRRMIYNNKNKSWLVEFRYRVEGNSATTIYTFTVSNSYTSTFESVRQFGSL